MAKVEFQPVTWLLLAAVGLIVTAPFAKTTGVGVGYMVGVMMLISFVAGSFFVEIFRQDSPTALTLDGIRKSRGTVKPFMTMGGDDMWPALTVLGYGGVKGLTFISPDKHVIVAPTGSIEQLNPLTTLIYSKCTPIPAQSLAGLFPAESDLLGVLQTSGFDPEKKGVEVRVGLLNALHKQPSMQDSRKVQLIIDRSARVNADLRERPRQGEGGNVDELRKLASSYRKPSLMEQAKRWLSGDDSDRPPEADPYSGGDKR